MCWVFKSHFSWRHFDLQRLKWAEDVLGTTKERADKCSNLLPCPVIFAFPSSEDSVLLPPLHLPLYYHHHLHPPPHLHPPLHPPPLPGLELN